jgi:hypothetical protein
MPTLGAGYTSTICAVSPEEILTHRKEKPKRGKLFPLLLGECPNVVYCWGKDHLWSRTSLLAVLFLSPLNKGSSDVSNGLSVLLKIWNISFNIGTRLWAGGRRSFPGDFFFTIAFIADLQPTHPWVTGIRGARAWRWPVCTQCHYTTAHVSRAP